MKYGFANVTVATQRKSHHPIWLKVQQNPVAVKDGKMYVFHADIVTNQIMQKAYVGITTQSCCVGHCIKMNFERSKANEI